MKKVDQEKLIAHGLFMFGSIIVLYPFFSILFLALSEPGARISGFTIPTGVYFDNFLKAWTDGGFSLALWSSLIVVLGVVSITILCSIPAAYAFEKLSIEGASPLFALVQVSVSIGPLLLERLPPASVRPRLLRLQLRPLSQRRVERLLLLRRE